MPDPNPAPVIPASPVTADPAANPNPAGPATNPAGPDPANPNPPPAAAAWPETWRQAYAGDDPKKLARLERFTDPAKAFDALIEAQNKIRAGDFARPLAENATDQERAEWRTANGIPDKPDGYFAQLPNGLVIGADDKPLFDDVAGRLHKLDASPKVMHELTQWYYELADKETAAVQEVDRRQAAEAVETLRSEWGNDFKGNMGQVTGWLDGLGKELKSQLMDATLPDGRRLFNSPEVIKWMAAQAREINPAGVLTPNAGENQMMSIDSELKQIDDLRRKDRKAYNANSQMQERERQLLDAQSKLKQRAG